MANSVLTRLTRRLHRWLGLALAGYLLLACGSGALLLWSDEYVAWQYPQVANLDLPPWPTAQALADLQARYGDRVASIALPRDGRPMFHLYLTDGQQLLAHPLSGETIANWTWRESLPAFLFELHAHLFAGDLGHTLVGVLGLGVMISLCTGAWLWWRRRRSLPIRHLLPRNAGPGQLLRSHAAQGAALGVLFLLLTVSGVAMVFPQPIATGLNGLLGAELPLSPGARLQGPYHRAPDWEAVLQSARARFPQAQPRFVMPPRSPSDPVTLRLRNPGELHPNGRSYLVIHPGDATLLEAIDATTRGAGPAVFNALYPLHAGKTGWPGYRLLLTILSFSLLFIAATGVALWVGRQRVRQAASRTHGIRFARED